MDVTQLIKQAIVDKADSLDLSNKELTKLPAEIAGFTGQSLDLSGNRLTTLPPEIGRCPNLSRLYLRGNAGIALPPEIGNLVGLEWLDLSETGLTSISPWLLGLDRLVHVELSGNQIATLPPEIGRLTKLQRLYIDRNQLSELPAEIGNLADLHDLAAEENPFVKPPPEVVNEGIDAIRAYFRQAAEEGFDYLYEAKLIIVGEPNAGKTTLSKKIVNPEYKADHEESTHGIRIDRWQFTHESGKPFYANIWDFGGQEIYHATHRFFLTESSCYVLVAQERREDTDFQYWLQFVQQLGKDSPMIILRNVVDGRVKEIPRDLLGKFTCYKDTITIDVLRDEGQFETKVLRPLKFYLSGLPHIGNPLPRTWTQVRKALEDDRHDHIPYDEFERICRDNGFNEDGDIANLCRYFHNIGVCLHYADDPLLKKTVILKPEWGTRAVYSILEDDGLVHQHNGRFEVADAIAILDPKYRKMCDEIIELMAKFELTYLVPGTETYIAPQLLPLNKPDYDWDQSDNRSLRYTFPGLMPKGMLWRFIVAMHQHIEGHDLVWRSGVVLLVDGTRAEIVEDYPKEIRIRAFGPFKRDLITVIDYQFRAIFGSYNDLPHSAEIACNCDMCARSGASPYYFSYEFLRKANNAKVMVMCQTSLLEVDPQKLIDDVFGDLKGGARRANFDDVLGALKIGNVERLYLGQHREEHTHMGDEFMQGQGFQGSGMNIHDNEITFQQVWNQIGQGVDYEKLAGQLGDVRRAVKALPESDANDEAVGKLAEAKKAAEKKDGPKVLELLKSGGSVVWDAAKSVSADVIVKFAEHLMGMAA